MHFNTKDITGQRFGKLVVINITNEKSGSNLKWLCKCDCGNEKTISGASLRRGETQSCGCSMISRAKEPRPYQMNDLTGRRFGSLTVIKLDKITSRKGGGTRTRWLCRCDCGNQKSILGTNLNSGTVACKKCSSKKVGEEFIIDLVGKKFGKWTVIKESGRNKNGGIRWLCKCLCGTEKEVNGNSLRGGRSGNCGCVRKEKLSKQSKTHGMTGTTKYNTMLMRKRHERKRRLDRVWNFDMEIALHSIYKSCVICGKSYDLSVDHVYPLSREIIGLTPSSAIVLCRSCNARKHNKIPEELSKDVRDKILISARKFDIYWNIILRKEELFTVL